MKTLIQDFRYALRQLHRAPVFTAGVIVVLALGISFDCDLHWELNAQTVSRSYCAKRLACSSRARLFALRSRSPRPACCTPFSSG